jgi:Beta-lactamase
MARANVPGLSLALLEEGQLTWSGAFGVKHRDSAEPVDNEAVCQAASLSKPVFAFAVMKLIAHGVIAPGSSSATRICRGLKLEDRWYRQEHVHQVTCPRSRR